jgi:hypothetical protein
MFVYAKLADKDEKVYGSLYPVPVKSVPFAARLEIVRPANVTPYTIGDIINSGPTVNCATVTDSKVVVPEVMQGLFVGMTVTGDGIPADTIVTEVRIDRVVLNNEATADAEAAALTFTNPLLPFFDLSPFVQEMYQRFQITSAMLISSNGTAETKLAAKLIFWFKPDMQTSCADGEATSGITYGDIRDNIQAVIDSSSNVINISDNVYAVVYSCAQSVLANPYLFVSIIAANAYVPASGEKISLIIKGYLE